VELRPILDREFPNWEIVFNPVFERALRGPGTERGRNFEPALLLRWKRPVFSPSLEYYGGIESINVPPRAQLEGHPLFFGGDWHVTSIMTINMGLGCDLSERGPGIVLKSSFRMGLAQGGPRHAVMKRGLVLRRFLGVIDDQKFDRSFRRLQLQT